MNEENKLLMAVILTAADITSHSMSIPAKERLLCKHLELIEQFTESPISDDLDDTQPAPVMETLKDAS